MDMEKAEVRFLPPKGKAIDPMKIAGAVKDAGFELLLLELQVRGRFQRKGPLHGILKVPETGQLFQLIAGEKPKERAFFESLKPGPLFVRGILDKKGRLRVLPFKNP